MLKKEINEPALLPDECPHVVREQSVKTHILEAELFMTTLQLALPISAQGNGRVITADRVFPKVLQHCRWFCQVTEKTDAAHPLSDRLIHPALFDA
jgi:hypothetical protein